MRFIHKPEPKNNETRVIKKFLFFPLTIGSETRWLEKALIEQIYEADDLSDIAPSNITSYSGWINVKWHNK